MATKNKIERLKFCPICNFERSEEDFYKSCNPNHGGRLMYCKEHCDEITKENVKKFRSLEKGLYFSCAEMGVPFIREVYDKYIEQKEEKRNSGKLTVQALKDYKDFYYYYNLLQAMTPKKIKNPWETFGDTNVDYNEIMGLRIAEESVVSEVDKYILNWGHQDEIEDYQFLDAKYNEYTNGVNIESPQQADLYRDLCRDRLLLRKITEKRYDGKDDLNSVQTRISKIMSILKVDQFENNKAKTSSELSLMSRISTIDENNVKDIYESPDPNLTENKLRKYYKDLVLRPLLNTLVGKRDFNIDVEDVKQYDLQRENPLNKGGV